MRGKPIYRGDAELVVRWPSKSELAAAETKRRKKWHMSLKKTRV